MGNSETASVSPANLLTLNRIPSLKRRLACLMYEGLLLFGVVMIATYLYSALTQQRHALNGRHGLQAFLFIVVAIYFVWFWSHGGQTVAMKAWHIRVVDTQGKPLSELKAFRRYILSWLWFLPALLWVWLWNMHGLVMVASTVGTGIIAYAALARWNPQRAFWHDVVNGSQLILQLPVIGVPSQKSV